MNWRNIRLVFLREVRDQLRDRRTLFMIFVLPLLLYPALGIGTVQMQLLFTEQPRTIVLLGAKHLPQVPGHPLLEGSHFAAELFDRPGEADKINIVTDAEPVHGEGAPQGRPAELLRAAQRMAPQLPALKKLNDEFEAADKEWRELPLGPQSRDDSHAAFKLEARRDALREELQDAKKRLNSRFAGSELQLVVAIPEGFGERLLQASELWTRTTTSAPVPEYPGPLLVYDNALDKSQLTYRSVKEVFKNWETRFLKSRLKDAQLPEVLTEPVHAKPLNVALDEQESSTFWSKLLPALLVIMAMTGAFYPAIDLVAGEKERGTMETLLISPASRVEIVLGKFLTVLGFSCTTVLLNLTSMGLTGRHMVQSTPIGKHGLDLTLPTAVQIGWTLVLMVPLAALFSALCLALATLARSSKEGQYYLTPLLMVSLGMTVFCMSPGIDLTPKTAIYCVIPIANVALLLKGLLGPEAATGPLYYLVGPVLVTSLAYAAAALWWAIDQFQREEVLFRDSEQFDLRLWLRHLMRDKEPTPTFAEALFCFVLIMLLQFTAMRPMHGATDVADPLARGVAMVQMLLIQQVAIIAATPAIMGVMLTTNVFRTFRLNWPSWPMLGAALVLPIVLHPLSVELIHLIPWPELPKSVQDAFATMGEHQLPWWLVLLGFAAAPAVCEEIAFRGFILSGFGRSGRTIVAVGLSALLFGLMHMIPQQVFNATLLGLVLGLIAVRSNSLVPCIVFHFVYNSLGVSQLRLAGEVQKWGPNLFVTVEDEQLRYGWPTLVLAIAVAVPLLRWLIVTRPGRAEPAPETLTIESPAARVVTS